VKWRFFNNYDRTGAAYALHSLISFFECLKTIPNGLQRVDTACGCVSSAKVSFVGGDGFLSLTSSLVNACNAVKAISDDRPSTLDTLATLPVRQSVFPPTDEPAVDLQGFFAPLQHVERSRVTPDSKRAIGLNFQRLHVVLECSAILPLLIIGKSQTGERPMVSWLPPQSFTN